MYPENPIDPRAADTSLTLYSPSQAWPDSYALERVVQDFNLAENYRSMNHDWRFRNADELYLAWMNQKFWEGTRIPRSSIGIYLIFEQVESLIPKIISAIFANGPEWFEAEPMPTTTFEQARATRDVMIHHLTGTESRPSASVREVFRKVTKDALIYCNGVAEIGWKIEQVRRKKMFREFIPRRQRLDLASMLAQGSASLPVGEYQSVIRHKTYTDKVDRPFVRHVSIQDFYIDPNCPSQNVADGEYCFVRKYMRVEALRELRGKDEFQIPDDAELRSLSVTKPYAQADWTKSGVEMVRTGFWQPHVDQTTDPGGKRIEVLAYWTNDRLVWVANRKHVLLNIENPYGFKPFFSTTYCDVPDRFYGLSISDVNEGEQRLQQSIINGRMDELSLSIHTPMVKRRGITIPAYQLRVRPGQIIEAENPKDDIVQLPPQHITQQAFMEVQFSEQRAQKYTGITDLAMMGAPSAGGNSAARTATGVNTQVAASSSRVGYFVEPLEDLSAEPLLRGLLDLEKRFLDPQVPLQILGPQGEQFIHDPLDVINADVKFALRASSKMHSKQALLQVFPLVAQTFLNPEFLQMLAQQQQMTVDVEQMAEILGDMTGYWPKRGIFRPMTQEMIQAMQAPPADVKGKLQQQQMRSQTQLQVEQMKQGHEADMQDQDHLAQLAGQLFQSAPQLLQGGESGEQPEQQQS